MIWFVFIGGMMIGACLTAIVGLLWEMRETRADLGCIRKHAEIKRAEALVDDVEAVRWMGDCQAIADEMFAHYKAQGQIQKLEDTWKAS